MRQKLFCGIRNWMFVFSETHFTTENFVKINGYKIYHTIQPNNIPHGGSTGIIRENLKHFKEPKYKTCEQQL